MILHDDLREVVESTTNLLYKSANNSRLQRLYLLGNGAGSRSHNLLRAVVFAYCNRCGKRTGLGHLVTLFANVRRHQHTPAIFEGLGDLLSNRPFREVDLDRDLVPSLERKARTSLR